MKVVTFLFVSFFVSKIHLLCRDDKVQNIIKVQEKDTFGRFHLNYIGKSSKSSGWSYDREEKLLILWKDSSFVLEQISQNGFEILPDSGVWTLINSDIILTPTISKVMAEADLFPEKRLFKLVKNGLIESRNKDRRLKKTLWRKE